MGNQTGQSKGPSISVPMANERRIGVLVVEVESDSEKKDLTEAWFRHRRHLKESRKREQESSKLLEEVLKEKSRLEECLKRTEVEAAESEQHLSVVHIKLQNLERDRNIAVQESRAKSVALGKAIDDFSKLLLEKDITMEETLRKTTSTAQEHELQVEEFKNALLRANEKIASLESALTKSVEELQKVKGEKVIMEESIKSNNRKHYLELMEVVQKTGSFKSQLLENVDLFRSLQNQHQIAFAKTEKKIIELLNAALEREAHLNSERLQNAEVIVDLTTSLDTLEHRLLQDKKLTQSLQSQLKELLETTASLNAEHEDVQRRLRDAEIQRDSYKAERDSSRQTANRLQNELQQKETLLIKLEDAVLKLEEETSTAVRKAKLVEENANKARNETNREIEKIRVQETSFKEGMIKFEEYKTKVTRELNQLLEETKESELKSYLVETEYLIRFMDAIRMAGAKSVQRSERTRKVSQIYENAYKDSLSLLKLARKRSSFFTHTLETILTSACTSDFIP